MLLLLSDPFETCTGTRWSGLVFTQDAAVKQPPMGYPLSASKELQGFRSVCRRHRSPAVMTRKLQTPMKFGGHLVNSNELCVQIEI